MEGRSNQSITYYEEGNRTDNRVNYGVFFPVGRVGKLSSKSLLKTRRVKEKAAIFPKQLGGFLCKRLSTGMMFFVLRTPTGGRCFIDHVHLRPVECTRFRAPHVLEDLPAHFEVL